MIPYLSPIRMVSFFLNAHKPSISFPNTRVLYIKENYKLKLLNQALF